MELGYGKAFKPEALEVELNGFAHVPLDLLARPSRCIVDPRLRGGDNLL